MESYMCTSSSSYLEEAHHFLRMPYLELTVIKAVWLTALSEQFSMLHPYVRISQGDQEWKTKEAYESGFSHLWGEDLQLEIDLSQSMMLQIFDRDEFGSTALIAGFIVPPYFYRGLEEGFAEEFYVRLVAEDLPVLNSDLLDVKIENDPILVLKFKIMNPEAHSQYSISIDKHKNIVSKKENFTLYEIMVNRDDGASWKVEARYSQVRELRDELISVLPQLKNVPFPRKTYFSLFESCCRSTSKFYAPTIAERKVGLQVFLNAVMNHFYAIKSDFMYSFFQIRPYN